MAAAQVVLAHVAVGCNPVGGAFCGRNNSACSASRDPEPENAICAVFGAKNAVAVLTKVNNTPPGVVTTLQHRVSTGDGARITSVFLCPSASSGNGNERVLAGDSEGNVFLWRRDRLTHDWVHEHLSASVGKQTELPTTSVSASVMVETCRRWICVVCFSDGAIAVLVQEKGDITNPWSVQVLRNGVRMIMETVAATLLKAPAGGNSDEEETVLVASGGVDQHVHLYELTPSSSTLRPLLSLAGHHDWIRSVAFERHDNQLLPDKEITVTLASGSQDQRIRLWKIGVRGMDYSSSPSSSLSSPDATAVGVNYLYGATFDALLIGHEDWVTSVQWVMNSDEPDMSNLISTSMDNTLMIWTFKEDQSAWVPSNVIGEIGGDGLLSAAVLPAKEERMDILALNFCGRIERWMHHPDPPHIFSPAVSVNGHCGAVTDLSWSPDGELLLSVSLDQTTRVLAVADEDDGSYWHEISRAQVHGYDINCGCFVDRPDRDTRTASDVFVCGADEKILRVFEAPSQVYATAAAMRSKDASLKTTDPDCVVEHAYLPELSLTNKAPAANVDPVHNRSGYAPLKDDGVPSVRVPVGDVLHRKTLWPEQRKLYGHGNELLCVASNHAGTLIASACKSREEKFAAIWLWKTSDWSAAQEPIAGHKSSVVELAFSPDDRFLLSVSKDRQFCVYELEGDQYVLRGRKKAHKRIIWSCSWASDSKLFAIGSRDQSFSLWISNGVSTWDQAHDAVPEGAAVTAVAFAPSSGSLQESTTSHLLAVGLESGVCKLYAVCISESGAVNITLITTIPLEISAAATITRLMWSPTVLGANEGVEKLTLAASSSDHSVRVYSIEWCRG